MPSDPHKHKYRAFLSYSSKDTSVAKWLHKKIENYLIPHEFQTRRLCDGSTIGPHLRPVFRDRDELSGSSDLAPAIQLALRQSNFLIVLCSPNSANSQWVEKEICEFKAIHGQENILAIIAAGEPNATSNPTFAATLECFPPSLRIPAEPLAADLRKEGDGKARAILKTISGITGIEFDKLFRRHERAEKQKRLILSALVSTIILTLAWLAIYAKSQQTAAEISEQKALAAAHSERHQRKRAETARAAADKVINTMIFEMREELTDKDLTPILDKILKTARDYWKTFPPEETLNDQRNNARIDTYSASIHALRKQGKYDDALNLGNQATQFADQFVRSQPFSPFAHRARLSAYLEHAITHLESGDPLNADNYLNNAQIAAAALHQIDPSLSNAWHLACIEDQLSKTYFALEDYKKAIAHAKTALPLAEKIYQAEDSTQNTNLLVSIHQSIGQAHLKLDQFPQALTAFSKVAPLITQIHQQNPSPKNSRNLSVNHQFLAITNLNLGNTEIGLKHLDFLHKISSEIHNQNPSQQNCLNLAIAHEILARTHTDLKNIEHALIHANENLALSTKMHKQAKSSQTLNRLLDAHTLITEIHPESETVISHHNAIITHLKNLPEKPGHLRRIIDQYDSIAQIHINKGENSKALSNLEQSLIYLQNIYNANPTPENTFDLAVGHHNLANLLLEPQNPITTEKAFNNLTQAKKLLSNINNPDQDTKKLLLEIQNQIESPSFLQ